MVEKNSVYVKVNDSGYVTAINSDAFLMDLTGWTQIDSGSGDKYHHAQGNYLDKPVTTDNGAYRYKLSGGAVVECSGEEITEQESIVVTENTADGDAWDAMAAAILEGVNEV